MEKNKMLIDATHPEETRVVVLRNGRVEEFDYESAARKLLRGNIYLAKVTRVEPSLQAAFVEYGGNRHGFLAFNEIHPDYYQIPVADRQMLLQEEAEEEARAEEEADAAAQARASSADRDLGSDADHSGPIPGLEPQPYISESSPRDADAEEASERSANAPSALAVEEDSADRLQVRDPLEPTRLEEGRWSDHESADREENGARHAEETSDGDSEPESAEAADNGHTETGSAGETNGVGEVEQVDLVEQVGTEDAMEEVPERPRRRMRSYKIQEVIKRRQIILVQVVKEERGNKGAALTTYLSLAGRYTVLMPNTGRGGGISRKITNPQDRKRLKAIANELEVPEGMGLIIRTAGASRTKQEIKRDYEYLLRLWESVRDMTLQSTAPCLVYEEGNLIKRSIRDLYSKDIDEIIVAGDAAFREAHDFMSMLQPGGARSVRHYNEAEPLFTRYQIERQLNAMFSPYVTLRSGGYLVINQTEALVSIDVNSGKSTREFSIEETALNTNLEAADEIARQLKLRDLAGLIVIDFIDMEEKRNNRAVERRLKDALRHDRARIQVGRISHFGLLEMSRQRLRTGVLEGSTSQCPHCQGTGIIRSTESVALAVLRGLEDELMKGRPAALSALTTANVALYILNHKRAFITDMEQRYSVTISVQASERMQGANFAIERASAGVEPVQRAERGAVSMDWGFDAEEAPEEHVNGREAREGEERRSSRRRRRRRGRERGGEHLDRERERHGGPEEADEDRPVRSAADDGAYEAEPAEEFQEAGSTAAGGEAEGEQPSEARSRRRRRGRRGGRNRERRARGEAQGAGEADADVGQPSAWDEPPAEDPNHHAHAGNGIDVTPDAATEDQASRTDDGRQDLQPEEANDQPTVAAPGSPRSPARESHADEESRDRAMQDDSAPEPSMPKRLPEAVSQPGAREESYSQPASQMPPPSPVADEPAQPTRKGWWQRRFSGD